MIRRLCSLGCSLGTVLLFFTLSCGGSEEAVKGGYSDLCASPKGCSDGFDCVVGVCTSRCTVPGDCKKNSDQSICASNSYCYEPCSDATQCTRINPNLQCSLVASLQGTCRARQ